MISIIRPAIVLVLAMTFVTGVAYPLAVTGCAQLLFPEKANGSIIRRDGEAVGSMLIGQLFTDPKYLWSRPSATVRVPNDAAASSGSNLGPTNPALLEVVSRRVTGLRTADPGNSAPIPLDLVTASGSGLDPHLSPAAAEFQSARIARARGVSEVEVHRAIGRCTEGRQLGLLGEPRVNVLCVNLALDGKIQAETD